MARSPTADQPRIKPTLTGVGRSGIGPCASSRRA